jgi:hypothetical protein
MERSRKPQRRRGMELFFIKPIILGGSPDATENMTFLTREQHIQAVRHWNKIIRELRAQQLK